MSSIRRVRNCFAGGAALWFLVSAACVLLSNGGCDRANGPNPNPNPGPAAGGSAKRIVILINMPSPYWDAGRFGMQQAEQDFKLGDAGLTAVMESNDGTAPGQVEKLRQFGTQSDIVAVAVSPIDATNAAIADEMESLRKKGVFVIAVDNDLDREKFRGSREFYIGTDNLAAGRELGIAAKALLPSGGEYVDFVGTTGAQNAVDRMNGIQEAAGEPFKELDRMSDVGDRTKARENVRNALQNHPEVKLLCGIYSYNAPAIVDVVREMNKRDQLKILTFDAEEGAIEQMGEGQIDAMVVQDPYAMCYTSVKLLKALLEKDEATVKELYPHGDQPDGDLLDTGIKVVAPADSPLKAELFGKSTKFLTLDEFRQWLAKYNLKSS